VRQENADSRQFIGSSSNNNNSTISSFRTTDMQNKQMNAANAYSGAKQARFKRNYDRDMYNESIQRAAAALKADHHYKKTMHENKLN